MNEKTLVVNILSCCDDVYVDVVNKIYRANIVLLYKQICLWCIPKTAPPTTKQRRSVHSLFRSISSAKFEIKSMYVYERKYFERCPNCKSCFASIVAFTVRYT